MKPVLEVRQLSITFTRYMSGLKQQQLTAVRSLDLAVDAGEITAVIGASGSGKSLLAHAILGILPSNAHAEGTLLYNGQPLNKRRQKALRGKQIVLVPQSVSYLNPLMPVGKQVRSSVEQQRHDALAKQKQAFRSLKLDERVERMYPFELSGGMARRVLLSTAFVTDANLVVADEPTPGMDEADVLGALWHLRQMADHGSAVLLITHDIASALSVADKIVVFYAGTTVEIAVRDDFAGDGQRLRHPYTRALWRALPQNEFEPLKENIPPKSLDNHTGCPFVSRCAMATEQCAVQQPSLKPLRDGMVRCIHAT